MSPDLVVSALGVVSPIAQGKVGFIDALLGGAHAFRTLSREGRQGEERFIGAEIANLAIPARVESMCARASLSAQSALVVLYEAWEEARLTDVAPQRVGLVIGGSNLQQRELARVHESYRGRARFVRPTYALSFMDTDLCGMCAQQFGIAGTVFTVGGASASGQLAIVHAANAVMTRQVDVCIALGGLMDLSYLECHAFRALGAMGSDRFADAPELACRPFDADRDGFIYGESSAAIVLERAATARARGCEPYAVLKGMGVTSSANRNPDPSLDAQVRAITIALESSGSSGGGIDYVNPHGTGSAIGDETELRALRACGLNGAHINATKSLVGHGLTAAGAVEVVATMLQMRAGKLHPSRNLDRPVDSDMNWVRNEPVDHSIMQALTMSTGFGGINTALCWQAWSLAAAEAI